jgi:hypothetical protein
MIKLKNKKQLKDQLIGDDTQLQVWVSNDWGYYGIASTYLIKNFIYRPVR